MAEDFKFLRTVGEFWGFVAVKTTRRIRAAVDGTEAATYTFQQAAQDTLGFYNDLLGTWIGFTSGGIAPTVPSVSAVIKQGTATTSMTVPVVLPAGTVLTSTGLVKVGLPASLGVLPANMVPTVAGGQLTIALSALGGLVLGLYKGLITDATNAPIVEVELRVVP